jgi:hypothetical protein
MESPLLDIKMLTATTPHGGPGQTAHEHKPCQTLMPSPGRLADNGAASPQTAGHIGAWAAATHQIGDVTRIECAGLVLFSQCFPRM